MVLLFFGGGGRGFTRMKYNLNNLSKGDIPVRCGYSGGAWGAVRPIKLNQWYAWGAVFFLKLGLYWTNFE